MKLISILVATILTSCVTGPGIRRLTRKEIKKLTTCRNTSMKRIRKNLMLAGYSIAKKKRGDMVTKFKQVDGRADDKEFRKYIVVGLSKKTYRFKVRTRSVVTESHKDDAKSFRLGSLRFGDTGKKITKKKRNNADLEYWSHRREEYREMREDVCGS